MKTRRIACGALMVLALGLVAAIVFIFLGGWRLTEITSDPSSAVIAAPVENTVLLAGDPLYVRVSAELTHRNFGGVDLYEDGEKYTPDSKMEAYAPKNAVNCSSKSGRYCGLAELTLLWVPKAAGQHSLVACVIGDEKPTPAWKVCTDKLNLAVVDPSATPAPGGSYSPQAGDTMSSVAGKFGLPAGLVAAANPGVDGTGSLPTDKPIIIPRDPSLEPVSVPPGPGGGAWMVDTVLMSTDEPIDRGYCYYSTGSNDWTRVPAGPQTFVYPLDGHLDLSPEFHSVPVPDSGAALAMECWGWSGASLVALGGGKTTVTPATSRDFQVRGDHFSLDGTLIPPPGNTTETRGIVYVVPPPTNLKATGTLSECDAHFPPWDIFFGPVIACPDAVKNGDIILIWDWAVPSKPPPTPKSAWITKIDGYRLYQVPVGGKPSLVGTISMPDRTVKILPKAWSGSRTFLVRAYAGVIESANSNLFTLGTIYQGLATVTYPPVPHSVNAISYFTGWSQETVDDDCDSGGTGGPTAGIGADEIKVGFYHESVTCVDRYNIWYEGSILFDLGPIKGPLSKATLSYVQGETIAKNNDGFAYLGASCADSLNIITDFDLSTAFSKEYVDYSGGVQYSDPYRALPGSGFPGAIHHVDVTEAIRDWMLGAPNLGFVFKGRDESYPEAASDACYSTYGSFSLTATYFTK